MGTEVWIGWMGLAATMLLVAVGLLNFSVFREQLRIAREQIDTAVRQLELAQQQPDMHLIQRATTEASNHIRLLVERPYLRPYFYDDAVWRPGDVASEDEVRAMAELILNNFASALMHSAAFPQYPVRGIDRTIMFHMRHSPVLRDSLMATFDRFPFTGLTILCLQNETAEGVEADLRRLIAMEGLDQREIERRTELLQIFRDSETHDAMEFTALSMQQRR
jgi:hypothetical protein